MKLLTKCLASLALATSLAGSAAAVPHATRPADPIVDVAVDVEVAIDRAQVRAKLAERRAVTIQRFLAYREARVYPVAEGRRGFHHVWIDASGNLCAAATLISKDWGRQRVIAAGKADNGIKLANVKSGAIADWMLTSGLTRHELVAIQVPGFVDVGPRQDRATEIARLYNLYIDVERQLVDLGEDNLELAVDALLARPDLARALLAGRPAGPAGLPARPVAGRTPTTEPMPVRFARPPSAR